MSAVPLSNLQKSGAGALLNLPAPAQSNETAANVLAAQAKALVEARFIMAMNRSRDIEEARQKILRECKRPGFAKAARYNKPVGKGIKGPSIRFVEAALRCMTNIDTTTFAIYDDREQRIMRVAVMDLESNNAYTQDVTVRKAVERRYPKEGDVVLRQRTNSEGKPTFLIEATDDDILNQQNALISKAIRSQGIRHVPGDIVDEAMALCVKVQLDEDAKDPNTAKRQILDGFMELGVTADQVREFVGHDLANLQPKELQDLRGLYAALRDSETTWREIMDSREPRKPLDSFNGQKEPDQPQQQAQAQVAPTPDEPKQDEALPATQSAGGTGGGDGGGEDQSGRVTFEEIIKGINDAATSAAVNSVIAMIGEVRPEDKQPMLLNMANNKLRRLLEKEGKPIPAEIAPAAAKKKRSFE